MKFSGKRAGNLGTPRLLADLLEVGFLFGSDLACVFQCFDALWGEFLAVVLHAKRQQLTSESVLIAILPIIISAVLAFLICDRTGRRRPWKASRPKLRPQKSIYASLSPVDLASIRPYGQLHILGLQKLVIWRKRKLSLPSGVLPPIR